MTPRSAWEWAIGMLTLLNERCLISFACQLKERMKGKERKKKKERKKERKKDGKLFTIHVTGKPSFVYEI